MVIRTSMPAWRSKYLQGKEHQRYQIIVNQNTFKGVSEISYFFYLSQQYTIETWELWDINAMCSLVRLPNPLTLGTGFQVSWGTWLCVHIRVQCPPWVPIEGGHMDNRCVVIQARWTFPVEGLQQSEIVHLKSEYPHSKNIYYTPAQTSGKFFTCYSPIWQNKTFYGLGVRATLF